MICLSYKTQGQEYQKIGDTLYELTPKLYVKGILLEKKEYKLLGKTGYLEDTLIEYKERPFPDGIFSFVEQKHIRVFSKFGTSELVEISDLPPYFSGHKRFVDIRRFQIIGFFILALLFVLLQKLITKENLRDLNTPTRFIQFLIFLVIFLLILRNSFVISEKDLSFSSNSWIRFFIHFLALVPFFFLWRKMHNKINPLNK